MAAAGSRRLCLLLSAVTLTAARPTLMFRGGSTDDPPDGSSLHPLTRLPRGGPADTREGAGFHTPTLLLRGGATKDQADAASLHSLKELILTLEQRVNELPTANKSAHTPAPVIADAAVGDRVRVRPDVKQPRYEWGDVTPMSVGKLVSFDGEHCVVDFPSHSGWVGLLSEMERVASVEELPRVGDTVRVRRDVTAPLNGWGGSVDHQTTAKLVELARDDQGRETAVVRLDDGTKWTALLMELEAVDANGETLRHESGESTGRLPSGVPLGMMGSGAVSVPLSQRRSARVLGRISGEAAAQAAIRINLEEDTHEVKKLAKVRALVHRVYTSLVPLTAFALLLGTFLGLLAAFLDRRLSSLIDTTLAVITKTPQPAGDVPSPTVQHTDGSLPILRNLMVVPLRAPSVLLSGLSLYVFCVRATVPNILRDFGHGFDEGFRSFRRRNAAGAGERHKAETAVLRRAMTTMWTITAVVQAARFTTLCVACMLALDWSARTGVGGRS